MHALPDLSRLSNSSIRQRHDPISFDQSFEQDAHLHAQELQALADFRDGHPAGGEHIGFVWWKVGRNVYRVYGKYLGGAKTMKQRMAAIRKEIAELMQEKRRF